MQNTEAPKREELKALRQGFLWATLSRHKLRWSSAFLVNQALPFVEVGMIFLIYALVESSQRANVSDFISNSPLPETFRQAIVTNLPMALIVAGVVLLSFMVITRYLIDTMMVRLSVRLYVEDSHELLNRYFAANSAAVRHIGRERISASVLNDCGVTSERVRMFLQLLAAGWSLTVYAAVAASTSWRLLIIGLLVYAVPLFLNRHAYRRIGEITQRRTVAQEYVLAFLNDVLGSFKRTKLDALEASLSDRSQDVLARSQAWRVDKHKVEGRMKATIEGFSFAGFFTVVGVGLLLLELPLPFLLIFFLLFSRMKTLVNEITTLFVKLKGCRPNLDRYVDLFVRLSHQSIEIPKDGIGRLPALRSVEMRNVSFTYDDEPILQSLKFKAKAGDRILITGPSGHGKSTFIEILSGLLPPDSGEVLYNDIPLDISLYYQIRNRIVFVAPNLYLFDDTLRANLTIGIAPDCAEKLLHEAITLAALDDVISALPQGLDTRIGTDGTNLSLGQRQRVLLARLYMKDPYLVLLDEATANLDTALEADLIRRLYKFLRPEAIVVMIAHKPPPNFAFTHHYSFVAGRLAIVEDHRVAIAE